MKVTVTTYTEEALGKREYSDGVQILIDDKKVFSVFDGSPEDNTLSRNFNDCYSIGGLLKKAYMAGKMGYDFEIENIETDEF